MNLFNLFKKKQPAPAPSTEAALAVEQLEQLGYFKYADAADIPELKAGLTKSLNEGHCMPGLYFETNPYHAKDFRHYPFDGESLFEEGGFAWQLEAMSKLFEKMDVKLNVTNHFEEWSKERGLNHRLTINGRPYIVFINYHHMGWGEAAQRFAEIINEQLTLQQKDERLYLINGGNDGNAVYLTEKQFAVLDPILKGVDKPMRVEEWCKIFGVDPLAYKGG